MSDEALDEQYLDRLEALVRQLLEISFRNADDLWTLQTDLLELQRNIQASIGDAKKAKDRNLLASLRAVLAQARRFGDALAWVFFRSERQHIYPLGQNTRVPVAQEDEGSRGALYAAAAMAQQGWGFPFLHDITNCLRIGDISFIDPNASMPVTVEVKSQLLDEQPNEDGSVSASYRVSMLFADNGPAPQLIAETNARLDERSDPVTGDFSLRASRRVKRQVERMISAQLHQTAESNTVLHDQDKPFVSLDVESDHESHWDVVTRVIEAARASGYASEAVEDTFLYAAFYEPDGLTVAAVQREELVRDLTGSNILGLKAPHKDGIMITSVPSVHEKGVDYSIPYYLYPLEHSVIIDLLRGRLIVVVISNPGRFAEALRAEGFQASIKSDGPPDLLVATDITDNVGRNYRVELHNLFIPMNEMVREFKGLRYLVNIARAMRDGVSASAESGQMWGRPESLTKPE